MNYKGKLYGRIGNNTYFDTAYTTDDWDAMEAKIKEIEKVKRKPLPDGTLELTEEELREFEKLFDCLPISKISIAFFKDTDIYIQRHMGYLHGSRVYTIDNYKAILWLADRFDLTSNN